MECGENLIAHHYTFIDKLLPGSFQTTAKISRVGHAHPDFFHPARHAGATVTAPTARTHSIHHQSLISL